LPVLANHSKEQRVIDGTNGAVLLRPIADQSEW
jgi:hypothetical protein